MRVAPTIAVTGPRPTRYGQGMSSDPRAALSAFVAALEAHLELSAVRRGDNDPAVIAAYQKVADAFVAYDDALLDAFGEVTPLDIYSEDDDELDDEELDDDAEDDESDDDEGDDDDESDDEASDEGEDELDRADGSSTYVGLDDEDYDVERPGGDTGRSDR